MRMLHVLVITTFGVIVLFFEGKIHTLQMDFICFTMGLRRQNEDEHLTSSVSVTLPHG